MNQTISPFQPASAGFPCEQFHGGVPSLTRCRLDWGLWEVHW